MPMSSTARTHDASIVWIVPQSDTVVVPVFTQASSEASAA
jgi:hypothetical protein